MSTLAEIKHPLKNHFSEWFLNYASYVILDRAIPHAYDGLKPVQRRILYAMHGLEDGRYNKAANIIGDTVKYHPHGDVSIQDALVHLGQKNTIIDTQGNWGNIVTGDSAAAPRYIEARLTPLAKATLFNDKLTEWSKAYDGRKDEPVTLPIKFPLLLIHGSMGIAVGLSQVILPHNLGDVLDCAIASAQGKPYTLLPDFNNDSLLDVTQYAKGTGKVLSRARLSVDLKARSITVTALPYGVTTQSFIASLTSASDKGQIRIKSIADHTAAQTCVVISFHHDTNMELVEQQLYRYTSAQVSISTRLCVIHEGKPRFWDTHEYLDFHVQHTKGLFIKEWELLRYEAERQYFALTLERWFISSRTYTKLQDLPNIQEAVDCIRTELIASQDLFLATATQDDIQRLLKLPFSRLLQAEISDYDKKIAEQESLLQKYKQYLANPNIPLIAFYKHLRKSYAKPRLTEITSLQVVSVKEVAVRTQPWYVQISEGFVGTALKGENVQQAGICAPSDEVYVIDSAANIVMAPISDKRFVGNNIRLFDIYDRSQPSKEFIILWTNAEGETRARRHQVSGLIRGKSYPLLKETDTILSIKWSDDCPDGITLQYSSPRNPKASKTWAVKDIPLQGRVANGLCLLKHPLKGYNM